MYEKLIVEGLITHLAPTLWSPVSSFRHTSVSWTTTGVEKMLLSLNFQLLYSGLSPGGMWKNIHSHEIRPSMKTWIQGQTLEKLTLNRLRTEPRLEVLRVKGIFRYFLE